VIPRVVLVAHREPMVAEGIAAALAAYPEIVPVAAVGNVAECEGRAERLDAAAIDAGMDGATAAAVGLRRRGVRVVMLGDGGDDDSGACVSTRAPVAALARALVPGLPVADRSRNLTRREQEILGLVARGFAAKHVARQLGISPKTVEQHKARIFAKLGVANQTAAVCVAFASSLGARPTWAQTRGA
jgi:DNA-binding NarL/FixJ family response regulator